MGDPYDYTSLADQAYQMPRRRHKKGRSIEKMAADAEEGLEAARAVVALIAKGDRDPGGGRVALRQLRKLAEAALAEAEAALALGDPHD